MLSLFPQLYDWSFFVPFVFRVFLAWYLVEIGYGFIKHAKEATGDRGSWMIFGMLLCILGAMYLTGIYIQIAGTIGFTLAGMAAYFRNQNTLLATQSAMFYLLIGLVALSLVFLGAGAYAFDLPL